MLARVQSKAIFGIDGVPLSVEVDNSPGKNLWFMVGLPDAAVKEWPYGQRPPSPAQHAQILEAVYSEFSLR